MNLIYQLQCTECNAFYIGETQSFPFWPYEWTLFQHHSIESRSTSCHSHSILSDSFPGMLVCQCHTQTIRLHPKPHLLPIWNCIPTRPPKPTHSLSQHPLTPKFHPHPSGLKSFNSVSSILLLRKATDFWPKVYHFCFVLCLSNSHLRAGWHFSLSYVSAALSPLPFLFDI